MNTNAPTRSVHERPLRARHLLLEGRIERGEEVSHG